jgi:hypothetical protein
MFSFTFLEEAKLYRQDMIEGAGGLDPLAGMVLKTISLASPSPLSEQDHKLLLSALKFVVIFDEFCPEK